MHDGIKKNTTRIPSGPIVLSSDVSQVLLQDMYVFVLKGSVRENHLICLYDLIQSKSFQFSSIQRVYAFLSSTIHSSDSWLRGSAGIASNIAVVCALLIWLSRSTLEGLHEVGNDVVDVFRTDRNTDEILQNCC